jgi:hypothetical protein
VNLTGGSPDPSLTVCYLYSPRISPANKRLSTSFNTRHRSYSNARTRRSRYSRSSSSSSCCGFNINSALSMSWCKFDADLISTGHSAFLKPALQEGQPARSLILRGVNLSSTSKAPHYPESTIPRVGETREDRDRRRWLRAGLKSHEADGLWSEAEKGGHEGWFNGAPFPLDEADVRFDDL